MKLNKKKVFTLALAVCLIAILSMSSLAWFTDDDSVTNDFFVAGSDDENPDDVFSIDVWEDDDADDPAGEDKIQDGIDYPAILPGDDLYKEVNVENTGAYEQYARVIVTVSDAHIWQQLHGEVYVPLNKIATDLSTEFQPWSIEFNADKDTLTYVLYYNKILKVDEVVNLFTNVHIPENMDRYQGAEMDGGFDINVVAQAVQTEHVGANAAEAFATVGMAIAQGNSTIMTTAGGLKNALISGAWDTIVLGEEYADVQTVIDYDIADVTIDANGQNVALQFTGKLENVVVSNIVDNNDEVPAVQLNGQTTGDITIKDSVLHNGTKAPYGCVAANGSNTSIDVTVDNCTLVSDGEKYGLYMTNAHNVTVTNSTFEGFGSWAIIINGTVTGNVVIDGCTFTDCAGVLKTSVKGSADWQTGTLDGNLTVTNNTMTNCYGKNGVLFDTKTVGTITQSNNTVTGYTGDWTAGLKKLGG